MPTVSVRLLRLSLVALVTGAALGAWLLAIEPWNSLWQPRLRAAHVHLMLFGWLMPFVLGTAHWILPRHASGEERGPPRLAAAGTGLIGLGVLLGAAGSLAGAASAARGGTACALAGGVVFLRVLWPRVKPFGQGREGVGESEE